MLQFMRSTHIFSIKMCIADYLGKGYLPSNNPTYENEVNKLVTDTKFCKGISQRAKYCYRDVSSDNLIIITVSLGVMILSLITRVKIIADQFG